MKRTLGLLLAVMIAVVFSFGAVAEEAQLKKVRIGAEWHRYENAQNDAWVKYLEDYGAEYAASRGYEIEWIQVFGDGTPTTEAANITSLVNQQVNAIICWCNDSEAIGASVAECNEANIPFLALDHNVTSTEGNVAGYVGVDSYQAAYQLGTFLADELKAKGRTDGDVEVIVLTGPPTDQNAVLRAQAFADATKDYGDMWKVVFEYDTKWDPSLYKSGMDAALAEHPEADVLFMHSTFAFSSVISSLQENGKYVPVGDDKHIITIGVDMTPQSYQPMIDGYIDAASGSDCYDQIVLLMKVLCDVLDGKEVERTNLTDVTVYTPANVETQPYLWCRDFMN